MMIKKIEGAGCEQEVLRSEKPVAVDFMADWCGYCKRLSPALERVAQKAGQAAEVVRVDIDESGKPALPGSGGKLAERKRRPLRPHGRWSAVQKPASRRRGAP